MSTTVPFPSFTKTWDNTSYRIVYSLKPSLFAKGKNILIIGGGLGIGAQTAQSFAEAGASNIAIIGRTEKRLLSKKEHIETLFPSVKIYALIADVTNKSEVDATCASCLAKTGKIHILIDNAGYCDVDPLIVDTDPNIWMRSIEVNVRGSLIAAFASLRSFTSDAVIVNVHRVYSYCEVLFIRCLENG